MCELCDTNGKQMKFYCARQHISAMVCLNGRNNIYWHRKSSERRKRNRNGCGIPLFECVCIHICVCNICAQWPCRISRCLCLCVPLSLASIAFETVPGHEWVSFVNLTISREAREEKLLQSNTLAFQWARGVHLWLTTALFFRQISETTTKNVHAHTWKWSIHKVMAYENDAYKW